MKNGFYHIDLPKNEPVLQYRKDSEERRELENSLEELKKKAVTIHPIINGKRITTKQKFKVTSPQDHSLVLAEYYHVGTEEIDLAIESTLNAKKEWAYTPWEERASIFLKAAALISGPYRSLINAATMLGQGKNAYQAEIDSACEWIDFLRFNVHFMSELFKEQPYSPDGTWNRMDYRPLDGFVFAATPFNFTAIAGNLPTAPAMIGNTVVWKPATSGIYVAYFMMKILEEAGLPPGVINLVPGEGSIVGDQILTHPDLAGVHFTGSTKTFQHIWRTIGNNIEKYRSYPRIVGETGGKDFIFVHCSADTQSLATALVRGSFEYQGQKCSQASRAYIPECLWPKLKEELITITRDLAMGPVEDFNNFINPVISRDAFDKITSYIDFVKNSEEGEIIQGGNYDDSVGYYIEPTIVVTTNPRFKTMTEEIFGPVLTSTFILMTSMKKH